MHQSKLSSYTREVVSLSWGSRILPAPSRVPFGSFKGRCPVSKYWQVQRKLYMETIILGVNEEHEH